MAFQSISLNSWLIGGQFVLERSWVIFGQPPSGYTFQGPYGAYYTLSPATIPLPEVRPFTKDIQITTHYQVDKNWLAGAWQIGDFVIHLSFAYPDRTREPVTLEWLSQKKLSFAVPKMVYLAVQGEMEIWVVTRIPGKRLWDLWPTLREEEKNYFVQAVSKIYKELSQFRASYIGDVDGRLSTGISPYIKTSDDDVDPEQRNLIRQCEEIGMQCDTFMFTHLTICLYNIIVRTDNKAKAAIKRALSQDRAPAPDEPLIEIVSWGEVGFVPLEWIATNALRCYNCSLTPTHNRDFQKRLMKQMEIDGMPNLRAKCDALRDKVIGGNEVKRSKGQI